jgi:hypothetical protein
VVRTSRLAIAFRQHVRGIASMGGLRDLGHYVHIVDTLEIARAFGLSTHPAVTRGGELDASVEFDPLSRALHVAAY